MMMTRNLKTESLSHASSMRIWFGLLIWRYSRPTWTGSCAACCRWPCFGRGVGLDDPTEVPSNTEHSVILW